MSDIDPGHIDGERIQAALAETRAKLAHAQDAVAVAQNEHNVARLERDAYRAELAHVAEAARAVVVATQGGELYARINDLRVALEDRDA